MGLLPGSLLLKPGTLAGQAVKDTIFFPRTWNPTTAAGGGTAGDDLLIAPGEFFLIAVTGGYILI